MYYYPSRFIPHVVRFFIDKYTKEGDWILDPFGGSGTVCVEALMTNRNAICLDINPVSPHIIKAKIYLPKERFEDEFPNIRIYEELDNAEEFQPRWSRIDEWYPQEFLGILRKMWWIYNENPHPLVLIALFKTSRKFSLTDDQIPKTFRSKIKRAWINKILERTTNYEQFILDFFKKTLMNIHKASVDFMGLYRGGQCKINDGRDYVDVVNYKLKEQVSSILTSPPYGMAHEYIRSFKLELAWLGYDDEQIRQLSKLEIPYRPENTIPPIDIQSETYELYREHIERIRPDLVKVYDKYFASVLGVFERLGDNVSDYMGIFVGNASFAGIKPPYDEIFIEHLENLGFRHEITYVDTIKARKLFKNRNNLVPNGIETESLIILKSKQ
ncbi:DNA methyltransferase [Thermococcus sp. 21S7]|uniref:DNA methyltransferase n=1 Tax=Thermococcus sp. 21S7 TaxID=1638221 RepID=UPI003211F51E